MAGYWIANFTIHDPEKFKRYLELTPGVGNFGGRMVVLEKNPTVLKGEPYQVIAVIEFESVEAANRWYTSSEYQAVVDLWVQSVEGWSIVAGEILGAKNLVD